MFMVLLEFNDLDVCISLFSGIELTHWSKLVPMMGMASPLSLCGNCSTNPLAGARFHETLTAARSLLIINAQVPPKGAKISYALAKSIPIVKSDWLIACIREQRKVPFHDFQLGGQKKFQIEGQSMLLLGGDASKRKANDDNEGLHVPDVDTPKRRRSQMGGVSGNGSVPGNIPQQARSGKGGVAKDESKRRETLILSGCRVLVSREELPVQEQNPHTNAIVCR